LDGTRRHRNSEFQKIHALVGEYVTETQHQIDGLDSSVAETPRPSPRRSRRDHGVGHLKVSPGAWALAPLRLAAVEKVDHQAVMVSLGRPGAGEQLLESHGFFDVERLDLPFVWEFADPQLYARTLAATGPAYEAIQNVGEAEFHRAAVEQAQGRLRHGLPLRAEINVVGYLARKPEGAQRP
jgi:hypothetical protein